MSKQREALELALEALEDYQANGAPFFKCDSAVSAIREALTEPARKPLTIEEITAIVQSMSAYTWDVYMLARRIEKAHGIGE